MIPWGIAGNILAKNWQILIGKSFITIWNSRHWRRWCQWRQKWCSWRSSGAIDQASNSANSASNDSQWLLPLMPMAIPIGRTGAIIMGCIIRSITIGVNGLPSALFFVAIGPNCATGENSKLSLYFYFLIFELWASWWFF